MAIPDPIKKRFTVDEYFELLARPGSPRLGYADGILIGDPDQMMSGGSPNHSRISLHLGMACGLALRDKPCQLFNTDMLVHIESAQIYYFPDLSITCEEPVFTERNGLSSLENPLIIFEVLSPSTEVDDRIRKFQHYLSCSSLQQYVLVSQDKIRVESFQRRGEEWIYTALVDRQNELELATTGALIKLDDVYAKIKF